MNVVVIGTGYVGLNTAVMLSYLHHNVIGIDVDENKINLLNKGIPTISENGLNELLPFCRENRNLRFSIDYRDVKLADVIFITVGTPSNKDGSCNLSYIYSVVDRLIESFNECNCSGDNKEIRDRVIVIKSTVPIGVNKEVEHKIKKNVKIKEIRDRLYFASNPEFLREGSALYDSFYPDRIVIGSNNDLSFSIMENLYKDLINREFDVSEFIECKRDDRDRVEVVKTDILSAEMIKYASNCFLAMKISYANEISNLARKLGANMIDISRGMGLDKRIASYFLNHGLGWGGSCFPKDSLALLSIARENEVPLKLVQSSVDVNNHRIQDLIEIIKNSDKENLENLESLENKRICLFGITFKPNTDDVRNSVPVELARELRKRKASVVINDPCGLKNARSIYKNEGFEFEDDVYKAVENADVLIISTEWRDYYNLDYEKISNIMRNNVIFDARNMLYNKRNEIEKYFKYLHF